MRKFKQFFYIQTLFFPVTMAAALLFMEKAAYQKRVYQQGGKCCGTYPREPAADSIAAAIGGRGDIAEKINSTSEVQGIN